MIVDRKEEIRNPRFKKCFHYFSGSRYVGAVWLDIGGIDECRWFVSCGAGNEQYDRSLDFNSPELAEACLKDLIKDR